MFSVYCFVEGCLSVFYSFGHCIVCSSIYGFLFSVECFVEGCLSVFYSCGHCIVCSSIYSFLFSVECFVEGCLSVFYPFGHCIVCSSIYGFLLHLWYLQFFLKMVCSLKCVIILKPMTCPSIMKQMPGRETCL